MPRPSTSFLTAPLNLLRSFTARLALLVFFGFVSGPMVVAVMGTPSISEATRQSTLPAEEKEEDKGSRHHRLSSSYERKHRPKDAATLVVKPEWTPVTLRKIAPVINNARINVRSEQTLPLRC